MTSTPKLFLDDLEVGQTFETGSYTVTAEEIRSFAQAYDPQPFHLDPVRAQESAFGTLVASGWLTAAITMRLLVTTGVQIEGGLIGLGGTLAWPRATLPGDTLTVKGEITGVKPSQSRADRGTFSIRAETVNQKGEAVQRFTATLIAPRRQQ